MRKVKYLILCICVLFAALANSSSKQGQIKTLRHSSAKVENKNPLSGLELVTKGNLKQVRIAGAKAPAQPVLKAPDGTTLYGELVYSKLWDTDEGTTEDLENLLKYGLYSFQASDNMTIKEELIHKTLPAAGGGAYGAGKLYFVAYNQVYDSDLSYLYFCTLDINTKTVDTKALVLDAYSSIGLDMAYDPVGEVLYMEAFTDDPSSDQYTLSIVNRETGYASALGSMVRMSGIAFDVTGQLYGIRYSDGMLCKINKATGAITAEIGLTGVTPYNLGSATFDLQTNKMYWTTARRNGSQESGLYEINVETGAASLISYYPNNEQFTSLFIPRADDIYELGDIQSFTANIQSTGNGVVTIQAPSTDVKGNAVEGDVTLVMYDNGNLMFSEPVAPGATLTKNVTLTAGEHKLEAMATHQKVGKSKKKTIELFVGTDGPASVQELTLTREAGNVAKLTWKSPETGVHGGAINKNLCYYVVKRMPDNVVVAEDVTDNEFSEVITYPQYRYFSYTVTGYYKGVEGATAVSNREAFGEPIGVPYKETFDSFDAFKTYLVFNENHDEGYWGWHQSNACAAYKYDTFNRADDWLITPAFRLEAGQSYKLRFKARSDSPYEGDREEMEVKLGRDINPSDFTETIMPQQFIPGNKYNDYEQVVNIKESGIYFIGFHALSKRGLFWLYLDDVELVEGPKGAAPGLVTDLTATPGANGALSVNIAMKAPAEDFNGENLSELTSVKVYRNGQLIKTFDNPGVGQELTYTDNGAVQGTNTYRVVSANSFGESNPVEVTSWAGEDVPCAVTNTKHYTTDGKNATIEWTAPAAGVNGGSLDYNALRYTVERNDGVKVATDLAETTFVDKTIDVSKGQVCAFYTITATSKAGVSEGETTPFVVYGDAYSKGYKESFPGGQLQTTPWIQDILVPSPYPSLATYWVTGQKGVDPGPYTDPQDGDNGMAIFVRSMIGVEARLISPKINVASMKNPVLTLWFQHYFNPDMETGYSTENDKMQFEVLVNGEYKKLTADPVRLIDGNGWYRYDYQIKDVVGASDFQISLHAMSGLGYNMHVDNITVADMMENDVEMTDFTGPQRIAVGTSRKFHVKVRNNGVSTVKGYTVELLRDGKVYKQVAPEKELAFAEEDDIEIEVSADITDAGKTYEYTARLVYDADTNESNNTLTKSLKVETLAPEYPVVENLKATVVNGAVKLSWDEPNSPEGNATVVESFENYEPFTITNFGDWKLVDVDKLPTYSIQNASGEDLYPNDGSDMAFMAFNYPKSGINSERWQPFSGNQMAACFASAGGQNDDWLISPKVNGNQTITFYAKSASSYYGMDQFVFCYSASDTEVASFIPVGSTVNVPYEWTKYEFTIPAEAKYFAIHCISNDCFALLVDDIEYVSSSAMLLELQGYNIYRDGVKLNTTGLYEEQDFEDTNVNSGTKYVYNVTAVYDKGESALSDPATVDMSGIEDVTSGCKVFSTKGKVCLIGAAGKTATICSANGMVIYQSEITNNRAEVELNSGMYIVSVDGKYTKVIVR